MMKRILENYAERKQAVGVQEENMDDQIKKEEDKLLRLTKRIEKLKANKCAIPYPNWIDSIVVPLAEALASKKDKFYEIYGPFGMRHETTIYLMNKQGQSIVNHETWSLTLYPQHLNEGVIHYQTGETKTGDTRNFVSDPNGFGMLSAPLPSSLEEIEALLTHATKSESKEDEESNKNVIL